jgi:hypothetical protein
VEAALIALHWSPLKMDCEVQPLHLLVPFDAILFATKIATDVARIDASPAPVTPLAPSPASSLAPFVPSVRTTKIVFHEGCVGFLSSSSLASVLVFRWQSAFMLSSVTQPEPRLRHVALLDPLEVRIVDLSIGTGRLSPSSPPFDSPYSPNRDLFADLIDESTIVHPNTCVFEHVTRSKVATDEQPPGVSNEPLAPGTAMTPFHQESKISFQLQTLVVTLDPSHLAATLDLTWQYFRLFPILWPEPAPILPPTQYAEDEEQHAPGEASLGDKSPFHSLRFRSAAFEAADNVPGRTRYSDDFRSMQIDGDCGRRPRAGQVTFAQSRGGVERWMAWKYSSPRSVVYLGNSALLSFHADTANTSTTKGRRPMSDEERGKLPCRFVLQAWDLLTKVGDA